MNPNPPSISLTSGTLYTTLTSPLYLRSNLNIKERLSYLTGISITWGMLLGGYQSSKLEKLKYLAERQHNLPKNVQGWYFFHKLKNYKILLQGIKGGLSTSTKLLSLTLGYELVQDCLDINVFERTSWVSSSVAGFVGSMGFSYLVKLPVRSRKFAILGGTSLATLTGVLQEYINKRRTLEQSNEKIDLENNNQ